MQPMKPIFLSLRRSLFMLLPLMLLAVLTGCENKRDSSDLAGQWQLLEWRDASGKTVGTKEDGIYYRFQLSLLQLEYNKFCKYVETPDSLIFLGAYTNRYNTDTPVPFSEFAHYGIPENGRFGINALSDDDLVLSGKNGVLRFRRY
jgi:hypothetical protein